MKVKGTVRVTVKPKVALSAILLNDRGTMLERDPAHFVYSKQPSHVTGVAAIQDDALIIDPTLAPDKCSEISIIITSDEGGFEPDALPITTIAFNGAVRVIAVPHNIDMFTAVQVASIYRNPDGGWLLDVIRQGFKAKLDKVLRQYQCA